jgi:hypothetical protein
MAAPRNCASIAPRIPVQSEMANGALLRSEALCMFG